MTEQKPGFLAQIRSYPAQFWVANTMEIFERMSWYGWFTVMALYVTGSVETGGLGFTTETRGALMAIVPFFLYVLPIFTGALADRYGFRKTFIVAYLVMIVSYYTLGQFTSLPAFFVAFMFVAVGAALFKPVVVGTVAKVTNEFNSATGFGIFYMMVNIGGFVGPIVAGLVRGQGWKWVFVACSTWAGINLLIVLFLYKEPAVEKGQREGRFQKVLDNMVEVLGNVRFFLTMFVVLFALMFANLRVGPFEHFTWPMCWIFIGAWLVFNFVWDWMLPKRSGLPVSKGGEKRHPLLKRMYCSNWRFALFLLIMSGFWTSFNQIFYTMPEYIRDFTETRPMIEFVQKGYDTLVEPLPFFGERDIAPVVATINRDERAEIVKHIQEAVDAGLTATALEDASRRLLQSKVRVAPDELRTLIDDGGGEVQRITQQVMTRARQFNPEFIVNIDAGAIIFFQVLISFVMAKFHRFTTMIIGMVIAAVGVGLPAVAGGTGMIGLGGSVWLVALALFTLAIGEMMASPTSQEYVGRIAPKDKKALFMGYYFLSMALGMLFGGILSGELYGRLARDMQRPDLMWAAFGGIMLFTAIVFLLYNRFALPRESAHTLTDGS